jgi:N-methylhydantoinase B/oxoprolinase/acetone carboxylase alpha subunit
MVRPIVLQNRQRKNKGVRQGLHRGGDGIVREIELLSEADVTVLSERRKIPPYGLFGGAPGDMGRNVLIRKNQVQEKGSKFSALLKKGDRLRLSITPFLKGSFPWQKQRPKPKIRPVFSSFCYQIKLFEWSV